MTTALQRERSGVKGTPTFFINGARHDGSYEFPVLSRALRDAAMGTGGGIGLERGELRIGLKIPQGTTWRV